MMTTAQLPLAPNYKLLVVAAGENKGRQRSTGHLHQSSQRPLVGPEQMKKLAHSNHRFSFPVIVDSRLAKSQVFFSVLSSNLFQNYYSSFIYHRPTLLPTTSLLLKYSSVFLLSNYYSLIPKKGSPDLFRCDPLLRIRLWHPSWSRKVPAQAPHTDCHAVGDST